MRQIESLCKSLSIACLAVMVTVGTVVPVHAAAEHALPLEALLEVVQDRDDVRGRRSRLHKIVNELGDEVQQAIPVLLDFLIAPESHTRAGAALPTNILVEFRGPWSVRE